MDQRIEWDGGQRPRAALAILVYERGRPRRAAAGRGAAAVK